MLGYHVVAMVRLLGGDQRESQRFLCLPALLPDLRLPYFAAYGRRQTRQAVFVQIIVRAGLHDRHREIFPHGAGHHQERKIQTTLVQYRECGGRVDFRQLIVGDDDVPRLGGESGAHRGSILHPLRPHVVPRSFQQADDQRRIALRILNL